MNTVIQILLLNFEGKGFDLLIILVVKISKVFDHLIPIKLTLLTDFQGTIVVGLNPVLGSACHL
jgi:hypothetical protein